MGCTQHVLAALLLVTCVGQIVALEGAHRSLLLSVSSSSSSSTNGEPGTAFARSKATGTVIKQAESAIADAVATAVANAADGKNASAEADAAAEAIARAYVSIVIDVTTTVMADGVNAEACAEAAGDGETSATAVAEAVAEGLAQASNEISDATADGFAEAVKNATIKVSATAFADACATDGEVEAFQNVKAAGYVDAIAFAFVNVLAEVSGTSATAGSESGADASTDQDFITTSTGSVNSQGQGSGSVDGTATAEVLDACTDEKQRCCDGLISTFSRCPCGTTCGTLTKDTTASDLVWIDSDGEKCIC